MSDSTSIRKIQVIDSHTGGEPTRVVVGGGPELTGLSMIECREKLQKDHDWLRSACISEPRGFDAIVGALLCESSIPDCEAGVVFFNNTGYLNGCIHGTIGVAETLAHLGRIGKDTFKLETPVGVISVTRSESGGYSVKNVRSYRDKAVTINVSNYGKVTGDVAWGGNWFFLIEARDGQLVEFTEIEALTQFAREVRLSLENEGITGADGGEIDHIEIFGPPSDSKIADSRNFVLCPGLAYDRSPCGTGTSAKLACLSADGKLKPGQIWRQAGILNTVFEGSIEHAPQGGVYPTISGRASIISEANLILHPEDPFCYGINLG